MDLEIRYEAASELSACAAIPAWFQVTKVLDVARLDGRYMLSERLVTPYIKDYDAVPANGPRAWMKRFELADWGFVSARLDRGWVGAAAIAPDSTLAPGAGPKDAVLWDLRVAPSHRGRGVGRALFGAAESWARSRGRHALLAETQNINVAACNFYARQGFLLHHVDAAAYSDSPGEVQLVWRKHLAPTS